MSRFREPVSGFTHLAAGMLSVGGLVWLILLTWQDTPKLITMIVYGASLILLYTTSTLLHLVKASARVTTLLNRFDHAAIYILVAGSYTAIGYNVLTGGWRWGLLGAVWAVAVAGVVYKLFFVRKDSHLSTIAYVAMGWMAVIAAPEMIRLLPPAALALIVGGGVVYSLGAIIYALDRPSIRPIFGYHEVWHLFVMAGSALHFVAVLWFIASRPAGA